MATVIFEYAAKFICGLQRDRDDLRLARGMYATEVNIHNPNDFLVRISRKKLALTYPPGDQRPGEVLHLEPHGLKPDTAVPVDGLHVRNKLFGAPFRPPISPGFSSCRAPRAWTSLPCTRPASWMSRTSSSARLESTSSRSRSASGPSGPTFPTSFHFPASEASVKRTGVISFIVMNRGTGGAGPSTTTVDFGNYGTISLPTQALGAGQQVPLQVAIPAGCKDPDCEFTITVDATNAILEADEGNNVLQGVCGG